MRFVSHALCVLAGLVAGMVIMAQPGTASKDPPKMFQTHYLNGQVEQECPLDAKGQMHGELRAYYMSGRLRSVTDVVHGQMGRGQSYFDPRLDEAPAVSGDDRSED